MIRTTLLALATGTAFLIGPASAGGPVITSEEPHIEGRVDGQRIGPALIIGGLIVACIFLCQGGDDPVAAPGPVCNSDGGC